MEYHKASKENKNVREAIWKAYDGRCPICKENISLNQLSVDHIIPQKQEELSEDVINFYNKLKKEGFIIDCIENFMPMHQYENREKSNNNLSVYVYENRIEMAKRHSKKVLDILDEIKNRRTTDNIIVKLGGLVNGNLEEAENIYNYLTEDESVFTEERTVYESMDKIAYKNSKTKVSLYGYIPKNVNIVNNNYSKKSNEEGSCLILFTSLKIRGCLITFNQKNILNTLFTGIKTNPNLLLRKFVLFPDNENEIKYFIQLGNNRLLLDLSEVEQLCKIIDDFYDEYIKAIIKIESTIGAENFVPSSNYDGYRLIKVKKWLWDMLLNFSREFDEELGNTEWNIFYRNIAGDIKIFSNSKNKEFGLGFHVTLYSEEVQYDYFPRMKNTDEVYINWKEGYSHSCKDDLTCFTEKQKWKVDYTYEWLMKKFIPYALYYNYKNNLKLFDKFLKKYLDFETYREKLDYNRMGIYSCEYPLIKTGSVYNKEKLIIYIAQLRDGIRNEEMIFLQADVIKSLIRALCTCINLLKDINYKELKEYVSFIKSDDLKSVIDEVDKFAAKLTSKEYDTYFIKRIFQVLINSFSNSKLDIGITEINMIIRDLTLIDSFVRKEYILKKYLNKYM